MLEAGRVLLLLLMHDAMSMRANVLSKLICLGDLSDWGVSIWRPIQPRVSSRPFVDPLPLGVSTVPATAAPTVHEQALSGLAQDW